MKPPKKDPSQYFTGKEFTHDWFSANIEMLDAILRKSRGNVSDVLEIGSFEGRSAIFFLEYFELCKITCIDTFAGTPTSPAFDLYKSSIPNCEKLFDANTRNYGDRVRKIKNKSEEALPKLAAEGSLFDLIYIDGDHSRNAVFGDSASAWSLLRTRGILIWDDYKFAPNSPSEQRPEHAIDQFMLEREKEFLELHRDYMIIVQKIVR